jgi:hypothetical protein
MSAYIQNLKQSAVEASAQDYTPSLHVQFQTWFATIPEIARNRPWGMIEFERALGTQGRYISPMLLALGWRRKRKWGTAGQYCRYWVPPV